MDRQTRRLFLAVLAVIAIAAAVAAYVGRGGDRTARPDGPFVDGVIVQVESRGLNAVDGFTLQTADGQRIRFGLARLRNGAEFPPGHLAEHVSTSVPVRVWYEGPDGAREAIWIEDAPVAPGSS